MRSWYFFMPIPSLVHKSLSRAVPALFLACFVLLDRAGAAQVTDSHLRQSTGSGELRSSQAAIQVGNNVSDAAKKRGRDFSETTACDYYGCPDTYYINADEYDTFSISGPGKPDNCGEPQQWSPTAGQLLGGVTTLSAVTSASSGAFSFLVGPGTGGASFSIGENTNGGFCQFPAYYTNPFTQIVVFVGVNQHAPSIDINTPCGPCARNSSTADPVDVVSGAFTETKTDLQMPGPYGLDFSRHYNSEMSGNGDLGAHWSDNFGDTEFIYSAAIPQSSSGPTAASLKKRTAERHRFVAGSYVANQSFYLDEYRMPHYYGSGGGYDPITNTTLSEDPSGNSATLTFFDGAVYNFDAAGKLVKKTDRIGNTQTIVRDSKELIRSVSDSLGRQLCFYYNNGDSRVGAVGEWFNTSSCPSSVGSTAAYVSYTYDSGSNPSGVTNCVTGQLCAATEPDSQTWQYGYDISSNYPWNLTTIYDPLGNPEVVNTYSGFMVQSQQRGKIGEIGGNLQFNYIQGLPINPTDPLGHTQVTNPDTNETTDYYFNNQAMVTSISGPLCDCHGYQSVSYAWDGFDRLLSETDAGNQSASQLNHVVSYVYGRDTNAAEYPGPTAISETLDTNGTSRNESIAYYPIGDSRQDLPRTVQDPSVDSPGQIRTTTLTYSPKGLLTEKDETGYVQGVPTTHTWRSTFDSRGRILTSTMPRSDVNETSTISYYSDTDADLMRAGQLSSYSDALSHTVSVTSNASAKTYDAFGQPLVVRDQNGVITTFLYDGWGRPLSSTLSGVSGDSSNLVDQNVYDAAGRRIKHIEPLGNGQAFGFDSADRMTTETTLDASGNQYDQLLMGYNSADELVARSAQGCVTPSPTCASWASTTGVGFAYDTYGEINSITDAQVQQSGTNESAASEIVYTNQGRLAAAFDENHQDDASACGYAPPSDSLTSVLGTTCVTNYGWTYDLAGRATSSIRALSSLISGNSYVTTSYTYDLSDNVTAVTDPNGNMTSYHYDDFGNLLSESSPVSGPTTYTYDADNNLASMRDATGATTQYSYDALDRPTSSISSKPGAFAEDVAWTYDNPATGSFGIGRLATMSDPTGTTSYAYDRRGLVTLENRNVGGYAMTQRYSYDGNGNRQTMTYADGMVLSFGYDYADRPYSIAQTTPGTRVGTAGILPTSLFRKMSRVRGKSLPPSNAAARFPNTPQIAQRADQLQPITRGHLSWMGARRVAAALHRLERVDAQAARALAMLKQVRGVSVVRISRALSSYTALVGTPLVTSTTYAPFGPMTSQSFGNGTVQTMTLDARYRPASNSLTTSTGTQLANLIYGEDGVGNITTIQDQLDARFSKAFVYDDMNRLTASVTGPAAVAFAGLSGNLTNYNSTNGVGLWGLATYQYDAMGNMTKQIVGARTDGFKYSGTTSLLTKVNSTSIVGGNVTYDAAGNETAVGQNTYTYSSRNELATAFGPSYTDVTIPPVTAAGVTTPPITSGNPWRYNYDGFGRRLTTTINSIAPTVASVAGLKHIVLYGTPSRISLPDSEGNLATETSTASPGSAQYDYVWMGNKPVAQIDSSGTHYTFTDHLNAPTIQTDSTGAVSYQADYEPFGSIFALRGVSNPHQPLRLPGQVAEQFEIGANGATDLSYNNARWYRSTWGRFSQADPLGLEPSSNQYAYLDDSPLGPFTDPWGLCKVFVHRKLVTTKFGQPFYHLEIETTGDGSDSFFVGGSSAMNNGLMSHPEDSTTAGLFGMTQFYQTKWTLGFGNSSPWGDLYMYEDHNKRKHTYPGDNINNAGTLVKDTGCRNSCRAFNKKLEILRDHFNGLHMPYDPVSWNSNLLALYGLELLGVNPANIDAVTKNAPYASDDDF